MKFLRFLPFFVVFGGLVSAAFAANPPQTQSPAILPQEFAGWQVSGAVKTSTDPAVADSTNAGVLHIASPILPWPLTRVTMVAR